LQVEVGVEVVLLTIPTVLTVSRGLLQFQFRPRCRLQHQFQHQFQFQLRFQLRFRRSRHRCLYRL
jgi:hypothetical protein